MGKTFVSVHLLEILNCSFESIYRIEIMKITRKKFDNKFAQIEKIILISNVYSNTLKPPKNELAKATQVYRKLLAIKPKKIS